MLLGGHARIRAWRIDERHEREAVALRQRHDPHRLPVPLGVRHAEVPPCPLLDVAPLLVTDERHRATVEAAQPGDDGRVVHAPPVAVQLEPVVEDALDVVERVGPLLVPRELDAPPDLLVARVRAEALELALQPLGLRRQVRAAQTSHAEQLRNAVAQAGLYLAGHDGPPNSRSNRAIVGRSSARGTIASTWPRR